LARFATKLWEGKSVSGRPSRHGNTPDIATKSPAVSADAVILQLPRDSAFALSEVTVATKSGADLPEKELNAVQSRKAAPVSALSLNQTTSTPHPAEGWQAYKKYLTEGALKFNAVPALKGKVQVSFRVYPDGTLRDYKIISGLNETYNSEAIRLIKSGPQWAPLSNTPAEVKVEVEF